MKLAIVPLEIEGENITENDAQKLASLLSMGIKMAAAEAEVRVGEVTFSEVTDNA